MKAVLVFVTLSTLFACATGTPATDLPAAHKDGGITPKNDGGSTHDSGSQPPPSNNDDAGSQTSTCTGGTVDCSGTCVDETSDPSNCGGCGIACQSTETCVGGQCTGGTTNTSNAPPQGTCSHSLCASGNYLDEGCDTEGCTIIICDPSYLDDEFCCTTSWDSQCEQEVTDYCSPYSCN